jgi:hypothetical protein
MSVDPDPDQTIALDDSNEHSLVEIDSSGSGHGSTGGAREWPASIKYIMGNEFCERFVRGGGCHHAPIGSFEFPLMRLYFGNAGSHFMVCIITRNQQ